MTKKRLKLKKQFKYALIILVLIIVGLIFGINKYKEYRYHQTYEYKLLTIGYSLEETKIIQEKLDDKTIDNYLNQEKSEILIKLLQEKYFLRKNLDRYLDYFKNNSKVDTKDIIALVNVNRDYSFYDKVIKTDTSKENLMLVNKYYALDDSYDPEDLVNISNIYSWGSGHKAKKETFEAFLKMWEDAKTNGIYLMVNSSYRDYATQKAVYDNYVNTKGTRYADSIAARPGHSEHETGLCLDIFTMANSNKSSFKNTADYEWLKNNSYLYGFIIRYPEGKDNITGYSFESWHYRYVGIEAAKYIHDNDITFDEYYAYFIEK